MNLKVINQNTQKEIPRPSTNKFSFSAKVKKIPRSKTGGPRVRLTPFITPNPQRTCWAATAVMALGPLNPCHPLDDRRPWNLTEIVYNWIYMALDFH